MQTKKADTKEKILDAAREEFLEKGFSKASLRSIASRAGVTKGNIYTYFEGKDALFRELAAPAMAFIARSMEANSGEEYLGFYEKPPEENCEESRRLFMDFAAALLELYEEFRLLFFASAGSSMEGFKEEIIGLHAAGSLRFYDRLGEAVPRYKDRVSELLIHSLAQVYLSFIEELIIHRPAGKELERYVEQLNLLVHYGMSRVIRREEPEKGG